MKKPKYRWLSNLCLINMGPFYFSMKMGEAATSIHINGHYIPIVRVI